MQKSRRDERKNQKTGESHPVSDDCREFFDDVAPNNPHAGSKLQIKVDEESRMDSNVFVFISVALSVMT